MSWLGDKGLKVTYASCSKMSERGMRRWAKTWRTCRRPASQVPSHLISYAAIAYSAYMRFDAGKAQTNLDGDLALDFELPFA